MRIEEFKETSKKVVSFMEDIGVAPSIAGLRDVPGGLSVRVGSAELIFSDNPGWFQRDKESGDIPINPVNAGVIFSAAYEEIKSEFKRNKDRINEGLASIRPKI